MSITLSAAADPFGSNLRPASGTTFRRLSPGFRRRIPQRRTFGPVTGSRRRSNGIRRPQRGRFAGGRSATGRGPGYLVMPANALIQFLASQSTGTGAFPTTTAGLIGGHGAGIQPGLGLAGSGLIGGGLGLLGGSGQLGLGLGRLGQGGLGLGRIGQTGLGLGRLGRGGLTGFGHGAGIGQPLSYNPLLSALGLGSTGGMTSASPIVAQGPSGITFLGSQASLIANLVNALTGVTGVPAVSLFGNQGAVTHAPMTTNSANSIIIHDNTGGVGGSQGTGLLIGGPSGSITIQGNLLTGGQPAIEPEEVETEETAARAAAAAAAKKSNTVVSGGSAQKSASNSQSIVVGGAGGKSQTITIGGAGGTFSIGGKTPGGVQLPANATFILNSGTTARPLDV